MTSRHNCVSCRHYRRTRPEPFSASDLRNPEVMEEVGEWKKHLARRQQKERTEVARGGATFTFEPWFYAWCGHYSSPPPESAAPRALQAGLYILADSVNADGDCAAFEGLAADEDERGRRTDA
jgi:hypothetical protein